MKPAIVIVGTGTGGAQAAIALRQLGYPDPIAMIGEELDPPYERPPLTKKYLTGEIPFERLLVRPAAFWAEREICMLLGRRVCAVDPAAHIVVLADGEALAYRALIWAAGGRPRMLRCAGHDLRGVHSIRNRSDVDRLTREAAAAARVAIVGGGFIGLEAAAALRSMGKHVTLIESQDRVLARTSAAALSRFVEQEHRAQGVQVLTAASIERLTGEGGRVRAIELGSGERIPADLIIVGIGIAPAVEPLVAAGAEGANGGVLVDAFCQTTLPEVYAVGDCAAHSSPFADGAIVRLESVQNARDQANVAARAIVGDRVRYDCVPWFWSNQYALRLQTVGLSTGYEEAIVRGEPATGSFSIAYLSAGGVIAFDCMNAPKDYMQGRALVQARRSVDRARLADPEVPLRNL